MSHQPRTPPARSDVPDEHKWSLHKLFENDAAWEQALEEFNRRAPEIDAFKGTLDQSPERLREALDWVHDLGLLEERLGYYAHLRVSEDIGDSTAQGRMARYMASATAFEARASFVTPEIQAIADATLQTWLALDALQPYNVFLRKLLRHKPHILSEQEERLLALQSEAAQTARNGFTALTDVDMHFGDIETPEGRKALTHGSYASFIQHADRAVRRTAYHQYLAEFNAHKHTLSSLYSGSVLLDVYHARVRNFTSSIEASLFKDDVPVAVYDNLIHTVHEFLPALHRYYEVRREALGLDELHLYDTRAPLIGDIHTHTPYEEAVDLVTASLAPLGDEYVQSLREGLLGHWVDRYENKGKRSGAFSAASYAGDPYILMNYKEDVLGDVFTLTHEAGHSMHSWYSVRQQPFQHYNYTIFVAEVASTFNEQLLARHLLAKTDDPKLKAYLINKQIDDLIATLFRQTLFAEFERETHAMVERNEPLTVDSLAATYGDLLATYFGPQVPLEEHSALEGLRVPHFYSAFYVYKYATGIAAALALSDRVISGGAEERERYLRFLKSGGSKFPLEQLQDAGVDMTSPAPVRTALRRFDTLVDELRDCL